MVATATRSILLKGGTVLFHDSLDHVQELKNTDVLVQGSRIKKIGQHLATPAGIDTEVVDCVGKIISPGFVDTHHHLWQTQLKGTHADQGLFEYVSHGYWQSHIYTPQDTYWGQLGGALEAIDAGTTFVVDHAHGNKTEAHADQALAATVASGIRSIFAYSYPTYFTRWDLEACEISSDVMPQSSIQHLLRLAEQQPFGDGRVHIGFGFDYWFLPRDTVIGLFSALRNAGIKLFTSHYAKNAVLGGHALINTLQEYDLINSPNDILVSHATGLTTQEKAELVKTQIPISTTPDTEAQMGLGWPLGFEDGINTTIGVDCHSNNTSSILSLARSTLQLARLKQTVGHGESDQLHLKLRGSTEAAFNAATIAGARAVQLGDQIGSIQEGKLADLVIFDAAASPSMSCVAESDALTAVLRHSDLRDIEAVIIDGIWRKKGGKLTPVIAEKTGEHLSWDALRVKLRDSQRDIQQRRSGLNFEKATAAALAMFQIDQSKLKRNT
ncbi:Metallo-dependent hydrolase [Thozetella sp. PMI_491]|nr:Metallo-dependent hydrolase [Thozetella sp. PMI_491]